MNTEKLPLIHPGEILLKNFLQPAAISQARLGAAIKVSPKRISEIVRGKKTITAELALRLAQCFSTTP